MPTSDGDGRPGLVTGAAITVCWVRTL